MHSLGFARAGQGAETEFWLAQAAEQHRRQAKFDLGTATSTLFSTNVISPPISHAISRRRAAPHTSCDALFSAHICGGADWCVQCDVMCDSHFAGVKRRIRAIEKGKRQVGPVRASPGGAMRGCGTQQEPAGNSAARAWEVRRGLTDRFPRGGCDLWFAVHDCSNPAEWYRATPGELVSLVTWS